MTDRPILFSGPMIRALLDGRKTQTRRVITKKAAHNALAVFGADFLLLPGNVDLIGYARGDRLWVRETWRPHYLGDGIWDLDVSYAADGETRRIMDGEFGEKDWAWPKAADRGNVSPLFMPRWASRLTLTVADVRVQRLWDISEKDAKVEGVPPPPEGIAPEWSHYDSYVDVFADVWDSLNAERAPWGSDPWVVALSFTVQRGNIDRVGLTDRQLRDQITGGGA